MTRRLMFVLVILGLLAGGVMTAAAAEFSATIRMVQQDQALEGVIYVKDSLYRIDMQGGGPEMYIVVDQVADSTTMVSVSEKKYMRISTDHPQSLRSDPFQTFRAAAVIGATRSYQGGDELNGFQCDIYVLLKKSESVMKAWIVKELGFPIKITNERASGTYVELVNIKEAPQDAALFSVPDGFTLRERKVREAAPTGPTIAAGNKLRLPVEPNQSLRLTLVNMSDSVGEAVVTLFRESSPLPESKVGTVGARTFRMTTKGERAEQMWQVDADEILISVVKGDLAVDVIQ